MKGAGWAEAAASFSLTLCVTLAVLAEFTVIEQFELVMYMVVAVCWVLLWWAAYRQMWPRRLPRKLVDQEIATHAMALVDVLRVLEEIDPDQQQAEAAIAVSQSFVVLAAMVKELSR